jgi:chemotaxis protein methyltransferase CheR
LYNRIVQGGLQRKGMTAQHNPQWSEIKLADCIQRVRQAHGLNLSPFNESFLIQSLVKRQERAGVEDVDGYCDLLVRSLPEAWALHDSLSVIYSEFFRNTLAFSLLEQVFLPHILEEKEKAGQSEVRVWSAGCATGQEAWSVAILLDKFRERNVSCRLIATDWSETALAQARSGMYGAETMGNLRLRHLNRYFSRQGDFYTIDRNLAELVTFAAYDLLDQSTICPPESIFGNFDLVLCCNVLFYYRSGMQQLILRKIWRCLAPGGYLITDDAEKQIVENAGGFLPAAQPAAFFKKIRK